MCGLWRYVRAYLYTSQVEWRRGGGREAKRCDRYIRRRGKWGEMGGIRQTLRTVSVPVFLSQREAIVFLFLLEN